MLLLGAPHTLTPADVWEVAHRRSSAARSPDARAAAQAIDLCGGPDGFAPGARALHRAVRLHSAHLGPDRPLAPDISRLAHAWHSGDALP